MATRRAAPHVEVRAEDVSGQVVVGDHNLVVMAQTGAMVTVVEGDSPVPQRLSRPLKILPRPFANLVGREREVDGAVQAIESARPVEVSGEAGIGKSALYRDLAHRTAESLEGGVVAGSARGQPLEDVLEFMFESMYEVMRAGDIRIKPTRPELQRLFADERVLVALDDVGLDGEECEDLMNVAPSCGFLIVSGERHVGNEAHAVELKGLPEDAAIRLMESLLQRSLRPDEVDAATAVWALVDGNPRRIIQSISPVAQGRRSLAEAAAQLRDHPEPAATVEAEVRSLDDPERVSLGVVVAADGAPVPTDVVRAVAGAPIDQSMDALADRGLIAAASGHRPTFPRTSTLDELLDIEGWATRLVKQLADWAEEHGGDHSFILEQEELLGWALRWAVQHQRWREALRLVRVLDSALSLTGRWGRWGGVLDQALAAALAAGDTAAQGWAFHQIGTRALCWGDPVSAAEALERALEIRIAIGDHRGEAVTRHNLEVLRGTPPPPGDGGDGSPPRGPRPPVKVVALVGVAAVVATSAVLVGKAVVGPHPAPPSPKGSPPTLSVIALDFGRQPLGERSGPKTEQVTNRGPVTLRLGTLSSTGSARSDFVVVDDRCSRAQLAPGSSCSIEVAFTPIEPGIRSADLRIPANAGLMSTVTMRGTGTSPELGASPSTLDFRTVDVASTTPHQTVIVRNHGNTSLIVRGITLIGPDRADFRISWTSCVHARLLRHGRCRAHVTFTPRAAGPRSAQLAITHSAAGSPLPVSLKGTGRSPPPGAPTLRAPAAVAFGAHGLGTVTSAVVSVANVGTSPASIDSAITPAGPFRLLGSTTCASPLAPGASCSIGIAFAPTATGPRGATLMIREVTSGRVVSVPVSGTGLRATATTYSVTIAVLGDGGGSVISRPAGIECPGLCAARFLNGTHLTLSATPDAESLFNGWGGACAGTEGSTCTLTATSTLSATASFAAFTMHSLGVTIAVGGSVTSTPGGIDCPGTCTTSFVEGTTVTLFATPDAGWYFDSWSGSCVGDGTTCAVTMTDDASVTALFYQGDRPAADAPTPHKTE